MKGAYKHPFWHTIYCSVVEDYSKEGSKKGLEAAAGLRDDSNTRLLGISLPLIVGDLDDHPNSWNRQQYKWGREDDHQSDALIKFREPSKRLVAIFFLLRLNLQ